MREVVAKTIPNPGDWFVNGLAKYPVAGFAPDTKSLMFYRSYADRHEPKEVALKELKPLDVDWKPTYWIAKSRVEAGKKLLFWVTFDWPGGQQAMDVWAVSMREARNKVMQRIGIRLCNVDPANRSAVVDAAKRGLAAAAGRAFVPELLSVTLDLK